jgi:glucokinase
MRDRWDSEAARLHNPRVLVVGVDLGGTNVRAAVVGASGEIVGEVARTPSHAEGGPERTLSAVAEAVRACTVGKKPDRVGLAVPGHVDDARGVVRWSPNFGVRKGEVLHYWQDVDVRGPLESALGTKVSMANDANAAALGEYRFGSGRNKARCLVMLTLGTGIGGGVVLGPGSVGGAAKGALLLLGGNQGGAELGHTVVSRGGLDSTSGAYGTVEAYCQRDSIVRRAQHKIVRGRGAQMLELAGGDADAVTPETVAKAADAGDEAAREVWREVGGYLGTAVGSLINVFAPDVLALGGQVALAGEWLLGPTIEEARNVAIPTLFADCRIGVAEKIADAGVLGAAALAMNQG